MAKELLWSEDGSYVYGWEKDFKNTEEFINVVKYEYDDGECDVFDIRKEHCVITEKGIEAEIVIPLRLSDIEIELFYTARVEPKEETE